MVTLHLGGVEEIGGINGRAAQVYEQISGRLIQRASDHIVTVSKAVAENASGFGVNRELISVVPNGVDPEKFSPPTTYPAEKRILFVGRLIKNKGPQVLLSSLPRLVEKHPDVTVRVVGTGPLEAELRSITTRLDVEEHVEFAGYVESVAKEMRNADIFCRPSFSEGMPLTLLEAMSSGLPAVVTDVAGVPEVVTDGENGFLVPPDDPDALIKPLSTLLAEEQTKRRLGSTARRYVIENHSWDSRAERLIEIYEGVKTKGDDD